MSSAARRLWQLSEPYHALTYFAPEARQAFEEAGLRGFWRGYFAGRAAPLGLVGPGIVAASFFGFRPDFVARAIPSVWTMADPGTAWSARLTGIDRAAHRIFGDEIDRAEFELAAELLRHAFRDCSASGRPLFAANAGLEWPDEPHLALWQASTLLREHRGDGHVIALTVNGLDPCEAHVTQIAASGASPETIQPYRGWDEDDWTEAADRLRLRGWLTRDGKLTAAGREQRQAIEDDTDRLAAEPIERLGPRRVEELRARLAPLTARVIEAGDIPFPNPIGVPPAA